MMPSAADTPPIVLAASHLSKRFGGVLALDDVTLEVRAGEVHGLLGHNGSGKSTLIKILAGYHVPERGGGLEIDGRPVRLPLAPGQFRSLGMAFVHQDPGLIAALTVVENLRIGAIARGRLSHISWAREVRHVAALLEEFSIDCDPLALVEHLPPWQRPLLAIIRALDETRTVMADGAVRRGILVLDEPTANLGDVGVQKLFAVVRQIAAQDYGVLFVSHDLDEVLAVTNRVTVLRDGRLVETNDTRDLDKDKLVEMIVGHAIERSVAPPRDRAAAPTAVEIRGLSGASVRLADITIGKGEIVGLTGLVGSGFDDVGGLLIGSLPARAGSLQTATGMLDLAGIEPARAIATGIVYVPGDRLREGCIGELTIAENTALPVLSRFFKRGALRLRALDAYVDELCHRFEVRSAAPALPLDALSGGNQQKVLLAKWLQLQPLLLILQEPTQGVDVGSREQIFAIIREYARRGGAVLCASSDHEQLAVLCDRVLVFQRGRIAVELSGKKLVKESISYECFGTTMTQLTSEGAA